MPLTLHHIDIDAHDLQGLAGFWSQALGWKIQSRRKREVVIAPDKTAPCRHLFHARDGPEDRQEPPPPD